MLARATVLHCCAEIEKPVEHTHDALWLSMNAIVHVKDAHSEEHKICCLFNYFCDENAGPVTARCYMLFATVRL